MSKVTRKSRNEKRKARFEDKSIKPSYPKMRGIQNMKLIKLIHQKGGKTCPLALMEVGNRKFYLTATEGMAVGEVFTINDEKNMAPGNILQLKNIPEGTIIHSVEYVLNDGGKVATNAGTKCTIENHRKEAGVSVLKIPSGKKRVFPSTVRAIVGNVASAGVKDKPLLKASTAYYLNKAKGKKWPRVRGVAMNPVDHPFGGGNHQHIGFPSTVSKKAPYAQQIGLVGARSTGPKNKSKK